MPAENIFAQYARPVRSVTDYLGDMDAQDLRREQLLGAQRQNALAALTQQQTMRQMADADADRNALQAIASGWSAQTTPEQRIAGLRNSGRTALMTQADALEKQAIERTKGDAEARAKQAEVLGKVLTAQGELATRVMANPTPQAAAAAIANMKAITQALGVPLDFSGDEAALSQLQSPEQIKQWAAGHALKAQELLPKLQSLNAGGYHVNQMVDPLTGKVTDTGRTEITQSADNRATVGATIRGQNLTDARARDLNAITREGQQTQVINDPERGIILVNKGTKVAVPAVSPDGKAIPSENAAKATKQWGQLGESINMARELLPGATASGAGALVDKAAGFVGQSTAGADAAAKLRTIGGWMTSNVPRMEGPQSDKDTAQYRIMAGQVGDETVPTSRRLAALDTLEEIRSRYASLQPGKPGAPKPPRKPTVSNW